jgi:hypothetical protein
MIRAFCFLGRSAATRLRLCGGLRGPRNAPAAPVVISGK